MEGEYESLSHVERLAIWIKTRWPHIKTAWYSGREVLPDNFDMTSLDYLKLGPFIEALGGLKSPKTNQSLYRVVKDGTLERIYIK